MPDQQLGAAFVDLQIRGDLKKQLDQQRQALEALAKSQAAQTQAGKGLIDQALNYQTLREKAAAGLTAEIDQLRARQQVMAMPQAKALAEQTAHEKMRQSLADEIDQLRIRQQLLASPAGQAAHQQKQQLQTEVGRQEAQLSKPSAQQEVALKTADIKQQTAAIQARNKFLASPDGKRMMQEQARAAKEMNAVMQQMQWRQNIAQAGILGGSLENLKTAFAQVGQTAAIAFASGTASMAGMIAAASPSDWATFTGSIQLLAASIGSNLLPYIDQMSMGIQAAARYWDSLSDATKGFITRWAVAAVALAGSITGIYGAIQGLSTAYRMLQTIGQGVASMMGLMFSPMGAAIAGLTVAVVALAAAWALVGGNASSAGHEIDATGKKKPKAETAVTPEQVAALPPELRERFDRSRGNLDAMGNVLREGEKKAKEQLDAERMRNVGSTPEQAARIAEAGNKAVGGDMIARMREAGMQGTDAEIQRFLVEHAARNVGRLNADVTPDEIAEYSRRRGSLTLGPLEQNLERIRTMMRNLGVAGGEGGTDAEGLRAYKVPMQTRFQDFSTYGQSLQEAAFKEDDQQTRLLQRQLDNLGLMTEYLADLRAFSDKQTEAMRRLFRGL